MTCLSVLPERAYLGVGKQIGTSRDSYNGVAGLTGRLDFVTASANQTAPCPAG